MVLQSPFTGFTGRGVRVAIIDSGVNPAHPHVGGVAGGAGIRADGESGDYLDYVGHGTAVAGAIREKAPDALLFAVKVFDQSLRTNAETIIRAMEWAIENRMQVVNLSLGTINQAHRERFERITRRAIESNIAIVAARKMSEQEALPGCLPGVIAVGLDWECPRDSYRCAPNQEVPSGRVATPRSNENRGWGLGTVGWSSPQPPAPSPPFSEDARPLFLASGYPRAIPGVPPERNLNGISFAVANMAGVVARAREAYPAVSIAELEALLVEQA